MSLEKQCLRIVGDALAEMRCYNRTRVARAYGHSMDRKAHRIRAERDDAYERLQLAYQDMQVAGEVIKRYAAFAGEQERTDQSGQSIYRRALEAWNVATRDFTEATREFMLAAELLNSLGAF
jgi:hypothetical protein